MGPEPGGRRFLVLDGYEDFRVAICESLRLHGQVADGLDPSEEPPPIDHDVVLMDVSSDLERLVARTRLHVPDAVVVAMVTNDRHVPGVDGIVRKPFSVTELLQVLQSLALRS